METSEKTLLLAKSTDLPHQIDIQRPVYDQEQLNKVADYEYSAPRCLNVVNRKVNQCHPLLCFLNFIPVLKWLPKYDWKKSILHDTISGATVAIMHIPHGMAYGLLGNLPPVAGIYMGFFPVLMYFIFGTSRHISLGTMAIVCLMTGKVVSQYASEEIISNSTIQITQESHYTPVQVATTVTFSVALIQLVMYVFRLGILTTLLSETLVNAFTCASAFHVVSEQLKDLFGLTFPKSKGLFRFAKTVQEASLALPDANIAAVSMSAGFILVMVFNNEMLRPCLAKKTRIPIPIELIAVIVGTAISYLLNMHEDYGITVIGKIPTGLPNPDLPAFSLIPATFIDAVAITMVSYSISISLALILSQKQRYEIEPNQELLAMSCSNFFGSFFSCMPVTASLSRSMLQQAVGGVTQIASIVSCILLLMVLLWIGPLFESLPRCVLASVIVVALKNMILQFTKLRQYWRENKWDGIVWLITFFTTVFVAIEIGLISGIAASLFVIVMQEYRSYSCLLGAVPNTELYLDIEHNKSVVEVPGVKIFKYCGSLSFASKTSFRRALFEKTLESEISTKADFPEDEKLKTLILDFSALSYLDPSGVEMLRQIINTYALMHVDVCLSLNTAPLLETLKRCGFYENGQFTIFPSVHDAVVYTQAKQAKFEYC